MKAMEQQWYDGKSFLGALLTILFAWIGTITPQDWATIMAVGAGATTIIYNIVKTIKEIKNKRQ
jgi:hypothetical protein